MKCLLIAIFVLAVLGAPTLPTLPSASKWSVDAHASPSSLVSFFITLNHPEKGYSDFNERFEQISDPYHRDYSKWMTREEVMGYLSAPKAVRSQVMRFVKRTCRRAVVQDRGDTIAVRASVGCVSRLFKARFLSYRSKVKTGVTVVRHHFEDELQVPKQIAMDVDMVLGLSRFPNFKKPLGAPEGAEPLALHYNYIYPGAVERVYSIDSPTLKHAAATQSVIEFLPEGAPSISDLQMFDAQSNIPFSNISRIVGPFNPGQDGESTLDIQLITSIAQGKGHTAYITIVNGWIYTMAQELFSMKDAPLVNSVSYGWPETLTCQGGVTHAKCTTGAQEYVARSDKELQKVGAMGITVVVCSQDEGAPSEANNFCNLDATEPLWPIYPGTSAFAVSVSATTLVDKTIKGAPVDEALPPICQGQFKCASSTSNVEIPCMKPSTAFQWTTGGGFSNYTRRPAWQEEVVSTYLKTAQQPPARFFNSGNRAYPDVSAFGSRILTINGGRISPSAGTSAATPYVAAIMTLLNDARLAAGKKSLGFAAPFLYKMAKEAPSAFNDIETGNNKCTHGDCCQYGYESAKGFDAVTGFGSFNVKEALKYAVAHP